MNADTVLANNEQAIMHLEQNNYVLATMNLRAALDNMRLNYKNSPNSLSLADTTDRLQVTLHPDACVRVSDTGDVIVGQGFAIHRENPSQRQLVSDPDTSFLLTVTLLFNLGLCYHLRGLNQSKDDSRNLQKALSIYRQALELSLRCVGSSNPSVALVFVAIGNNMCSVAAALLLFDDVKAILEWTHLQSTNIALNVPFFWSNVLFWKYMSASPAPAA
mmetsp:Transcript_18117/g.34378  ORF Transcript_18117/g.34378 Transcript_18117/m.34378 type:complete len:218 (-) Transcript_18117:45-698(-)|eukprot:scaffold451_cov184-Amphora_coffeaeformis.AAC.8